LGGRTLEVGGLSLGDLTDPRLKIVENIDGRPCFRLVASGVRGQRYTLWIDMETYLLRQTTSRLYPHNDGRFWETTIRYQPQVDVPLSEAQFAAPHMIEIHIRRSTSSRETQRAEGTMNKWLLHRERERETQP
jgi:hypothetical protein